MNKNPFPQFVVYTIGTMFFLIMLFVTALDGGNRMRLYLKNKTEDSGMTEWKLTESAVIKQNNGVETKTEKPELYAQSAVLMDGKTGRVLFEKNGEQQRPMASTTKIMTCILALEYGNGEDIVKVSKNAASQPKVHLGASAGMEFYLKDLLYSLMLESHNDTAMMIAEHIGGSEENFALMMNEKAAEIGCKNTFFITPNGLDSINEKQERHATTAVDLDRIMRYCIMESPARELFKEICRCSNYSFTDVSGKMQFACRNHNALLNMRTDVIAGKTGFTGDAGYCYITAVNMEGRIFIISLLACGWPPHKTYKWNDITKLLTYADKTFHYQQVKITPQSFHIEIMDADKGNGVYQNLLVGMRLKNNKQILEVLAAEGENLERKIWMVPKLAAPVYKDSIIGKVEFYLKDSLVESYPLYAESNIEKKDYLYWIYDLGEKYLP